MDLEEVIITSRLGLNSFDHLLNSDLDPRNLDGIQGQGTFRASFPVGSNLVFVFKRTACSVPPR